VQSHHPRSTITLYTSNNINIDNNNNNNNRSMRSYEIWGHCISMLFELRMHLFHICSITHAGIVAGVGIAFSRFCRSVCPCCKGKTAWAIIINTKLCTRILYNSRSACIDPEVKRSKVKVTRLRKPPRRTVASASDHGWYFTVVSYTYTPLCCLRPLPALARPACPYDCLCFLDK